MDFPQYYNNGFHQLPYHKEEVAAVIAGNDILGEVNLIAPFSQGTQLTLAY